MRTLFELFEEAIPNACNKVFLADPGNNASRYLMNNPELGNWTPIHKHYYIDAPPAVSGMRLRFGLPDLALMKGRPVWHSDELALAHFYRSAGYHEFLRPLGFHHMLWLVFEEQGETLGYCPIWRGPDMRPFTRDDVRFATLAAPHVAYGLRLAYLLESMVLSNQNEFVTGAPVGIVIMDTRGQVLAADPEASIFLQMGIFDGLQAEMIEGVGVRPAFDYIGRMMRGIFDDFGSCAAASQPPMVKVFSHRTGATVKLRGFRTVGIGHRQFFSVLVERGELAPHRRARLVARFGLSPNETKILDALRQNQPPRHITSRLEITPGTLKSYARRLSDKLGMPGFGGLRQFAHDSWVLEADGAQPLRS